MRPWQAILLAVIVGFFALATGSHPLYVVLYVLILMLVVCYFWTRLNLRGLRFSRGAPSGRIQVGGSPGRAFDFGESSLVPQALGTGGG